MSNINDFIISNGVLRKYNGDDTDVVIPAGVTSIGDYAFKWCQNLLSITIPDSVTSIGNEAFCYCHNLTSVTIPDSVTSIGERVFCLCTGLTSVTLPDSVTSIGDVAFSGCSGLTSVALPDSVTSIGHNSFNGCSGLTSVTIPDSVTSIGHEAFRDCTGLTSVTIPDSVTDISNYAFKCCKSLTSVTIGNGVTDIGEEAFLGCESLASIMVPDGVTSIGDKAFFGCENLTSISIPDSVVQIGFDAFFGCKKLDLNIWKNGGYLGDEENPYRALVTYTTDNNKTLSVHADTKVMISLGEARYGKTVATLVLEGKDISLTSDVVKYCKTLKKIEVLDDRLYFTALPPAVLKKMSPPTPAAFAYIYLLNSGKGWETYFYEYVGDCNAVVSEFANALSFVPKVNKKITQKICYYINSNYRIVSPASVATFYNNVKEAYPDVAKALEENEGCADLIAEAYNSDTASQERHPIEKLVDEYLLNNGMPANETNVAKKGLPFKNSDGVSSHQAVRVLLDEYVKLWDKFKVSDVDGYSTIYQLRIPKTVTYPETADKIAAELDGDALSEFLENLIRNETDTYQPYIIAYIRFATEESIERCISLIKSRKKSNAKCRCWSKNMTEALYCCDLPAVVEYIESNGDMSRYTALRGMSVQEYRDKKSLPDFGFNEEGVKTYCVDGKTYEVCIGATLTLELSLDGKAVRSIPKKTPEGEAAAADFAMTKKAFADFAKKRIEYIKSIYITGETIAPESWVKTYYSNPLLLPFTERVIWQNGNNVFFEVTNGKIFDVNGNEFTPDEPVRIAHVLDMTKEEIEQWQARTVALKKPLIIEQVWEPVASIGENDNVADRYNGSVLTKQERNEFKKALKAKAITVKSEEQDAEFNHHSCTYEFSNENTMIIGRSIWLEYVVDPDTGDITLGEMNEQVLSRETNTVLFELDRLCVKHHILTNNHVVLTENILNKFTLAQITGFIDLAAESNSTDCTALLLDFRNKTFGEYDTFDMFVL